MIELRQRTLWQRLARLWPPHRRRQDAALEAAIARLVDNPALPCVIDGVMIPHGYGYSSGGNGPLQNPLFH